MNLKTLASHLPALLLPLLSIVAYYCWPAGDGPLRFESASWTDSPWTLVTTSFLHTNLNHLLMNLAAYGFIYSYARESLTSWRMPLVAILCGVLSTLGFALSPTPLSSLVGLSGALHGCLVYVAICEWRQSPKLMSITLMAVVLKIAWEQLVGAPQQTAELIGASVAVWSHLWGSVAGALLALNRLLFCSKV